MITIRDATEADAEALAELNHEFNGVRRSAEEILEEASRRAEAAGASELVLRTNARNAAAQQLFERGGFEAAPHIVYRRVLRGAT
jgi:N-acetylglutamate synthase-like GNAT family acetyltransferase